MWFFVKFILLVSGVSAITCPNGFTALNDKKCVQLFTTAATHLNAGIACSQLGGNLISIQNAIDNNAITQLAQTASNPIWLGLKCTQSRTPSSCQWDDQSGNAGTYNSFSNGYPVIEVGNCVYLLTQGTLSGKWSSGDCGSTALNYICEVAPTDPNTSTCSFTYNGNCYFPLTSELSQQEAQYACQSNCGNLVSIHSTGENDFVSKLFSGNIPTYIRIGAKSFDNGTHIWSDGTSFDYNNIGYDNIKLGQCYSMALVNDIVNAGKWISSKCDTALPFVCKRPQGTQCTTSTVSPTSTYGQCNGPMFLDNSGSFYSPNYPQTYVGFQSQPCSYILDTPVGTNAIIQFPVFQLDNQASIALYNRLEDTEPFQVLTSQFYSTNTWYNSSTNTMKVIFRPCTSNCQNGQTYNWRANFQPSTIIQPTNPSVTVTPNPNNPSGCNATLLIAPAQITSPNYPSFYPNSIECLYHLSTSGGYRINLYLKNVDVEKNFDYLRIYDSAFQTGTVLDTLTGTYQDKIYQSTSNNMLVVFSSDSSGQSTGFTGNFGAF
ncbi:unnamed protein product [Caenorhabditis angaria]|uniref:C-type LECtin n=1 Tax=Caenorhabditis angaria TaxID=860376 RepID=A0A9P1N565_9PELO|nr:unnamed protein product [Caenorhabditis angaria]